MNLRATGGATHKAGPVKVQPPFLNNNIEILIAPKVGGGCLAVSLL